MMPTATPALALGFVGICTAFVLLYYATGVLLHFVTFDDTAIETYTERLRQDPAFELFLATVVVHSAGMAAAAASTVVAPRTTDKLLLFASAVLATGLTLFLRRMNNITRVT